MVCERGEAGVRATTVCGQIREVRLRGKTSRWARCPSARGRAAPAVRRWSRRRRGDVRLRGVRRLREGVEEEGTLFEREVEEVGDVARPAIPRCTGKHLERQ